MTTAEGKVTYTLSICSTDRSSGNHNNAVFDIAWDQVLPPNFTAFKVSWCMQTSGGIYKDGNVNYCTGRVFADFGCRSYNWDTTRRGPGTSIGFIFRDQQTSTTASNYLSCWNDFNCPKVIQRPSGNFLNVMVTNNTSGGLLFDTDSGGVPKTDMTSWFMIMEFTPIEDSLIWDQRFQGV